jgi:hypothetical protein
MTKSSNPRRVTDSQIAFAASRHAEMTAEFGWAILGMPMPVGQKTPSPWLAKIVKKMFSPLAALKARIDPLHTGSDMTGALLEITGAELTMLSFIDKLTPSIREAVDADPDVRRLCDKLVASVKKTAKPLLKKQSEAAKKLLSNATPANAQQIQRNVASLQRGTTAVIGKDGEFVGSKTITYQLCGDMWTYWSLLSRLSSAREVHAALNDLPNRAYSRKLVDKLCSEFGMFRGKRGRPAKKMLRIGGRA